MTYATPTMTEVARSIIERGEGFVGKMTDAERREYLTRETEWPKAAVDELVAAIRAVA